MTDPTPPPVVDPAARLSYSGTGVEDVDPAAPPWAPLVRWYAEAGADPRIAEPGAMVVATVDAAGRPNARTVLLKSLTPQGLDFYTNLRSAKAAEVAATGHASLVLLWHPMFRQVRVRGPVVPVGRKDAAAYFASRPRGSQVAAWASRQSAPLQSRQQLLDAVARVEDAFPPVGDPPEPLPLPDFWGGLRVLPVEVELWVGQESRLHDRLVWTTLDGLPARLDDAAAWTQQRRQP
jgi:pyridoxamine 5'-phosphate oxidase